MMMPLGPTPFQMGQGGMNINMMLNQFMQGFIQYAEQQQQNQQQTQQQQQNQQLQYKCTTQQTKGPSRATPKAETVFEHNVG